MSVLSFPVSTSHLILKSNPIFLHLFKNLFYLNSTFSSGGELKYNSSCALLDNGAVKCWGGGTYGQLGIENGGAFEGDDPGEMAALPSINL